MLADQNLTIVVRKKTCSFLQNLTSYRKCNNETGYANEAVASFKTNDEKKDSFLFTLPAISCQISLSASRDGKFRGDETDGGLGRRCAHRARRRRKLMNKDQSEEVSIAR